MSVLVLTDAEVRELLDMKSCIEAMTGVLAALQREELSMPLRFVFRPQASTSLMGFMPAHRAGGSPLFSLKEIAISPGNSAKGMDPHQGAVLLHDGDVRRMGHPVLVFELHGLRSVVETVGGRGDATPQRMFCFKTSEARPAPPATGSEVSNSYFSYPTSLPPQISRAFGSSSSCPASTVLLRKLLSTSR